MNAGNASAFTLDGTRTAIVGRSDVAVIDPGPDVEDHIRALALALEGARSVSILVTHHHADHAGGAVALSQLLGGAELLGPGDVSGVTRVIGDGFEVPTDSGPLLAVDTPGHSREHLSFHWPARDGVFVGDLLLGEGDTTWVAEYPGCVADYLESLDRLEAIGVSELYPAHGPPLHDPAEAIARFRSHRLNRIDQVRTVLADRPDMDIEGLLEAVYGAALPPRMAGAAAQSVGALAEYVRGVHG